MSNLFVMTVHYKAPIESIDAALKEHRDYLKKGYEAGFLLASGSQNPRVGGVIIGKFADKQAAETFKQQDPFVQKGLVEYHIIEFSPVLHHEAIKTFIDSDSQ